MGQTRPALVIALVAGLFGVGWFVRGQLGFELSTESIRTWVESLGWLGPAIFVLAVTFRHFLFLPSSTIWLLVAGLLFPVAVATAIGGLGVFLSALLWFAIARVFGRDWLKPRLGRRFEEIEPHLERAGPLLVGLTTAHPISPMTGFHMAAGVAALPVASFVLAVGIGSPTRAFACSLFGSTLLDVGSPAFLAATGVIVVTLIIPLAHPGLRDQILNRARRPRGEPGPSSEEPTGS
jgi:uncharacterized membrane protein YdjX (TVP38/TMEM64 family)